MFRARIQTSKILNKSHCIDFTFFGVLFSVFELSLLMM